MPAPRYLPAWDTLPNVWKGMNLEGQIAIGRSA
jgi:hypothetical protein